MMTHHPFAQAARRELAAITVASRASAPLDFTENSNLMFVQQIIPCKSTWKNRSEKPTETLIFPPSLVC